MMPDFERSTRLSAGLVAMASTLAVAVDLNRRRRSRQRGIDPSTIEPRDLVVRSLRESSKEIFTRFLDLAPLPEAASLEATLPIETLKTILALRYIQSLVSLVHQRLLSLHPDVDDTLIERARLFRSELSGVLAGDDPLNDRVLADLASRGIGFAADVEQAAM